MGEHGHHRLREVGIFEPYGPLLDAEVFKVMGNGVNHSHFVIKANDMVEMGELPDILDIGLGYAKSDFSFLGDHGIRTKTSITCKIEHVSWLVEQENINRGFFH